jgi:hypothetical protein
MSLASNTVGQAEVWKNVVFYGTMIQRPTDGKTFKAAFRQVGERLRYYLEDTHKSEPDLMTEFRKIRQKTSTFETVKVEKEDDVVVIWGWTTVTVTTSTTTTTPSDKAVTITTTTSSPTGAESQ